MLIELSSDLGVTVHAAGLLITFGAVVLCVGSPLTAWLTSRIERRTLLTATLAVLALTNAASAFAPDYRTLLIIRLVMLGIGALYTPQAAGSAAAHRCTGKARQHHCLCVSWMVAGGGGRSAADYPRRQPLWLAGGLWRHRHRRRLQFLCWRWRLPAGLIGARVDLKTWTEVGRSRVIVVLLLIATLQMSASSSCSPSWGRFDRS